MVRVASFTEAGGHETNEDAFVVWQHPLDSNVWVCFVADGQGGRFGGKVAAELACQVGLNQALNLLPELLMTVDPWSKIFREIDREVMAEPRAGLTALVGFTLSADRLVGASCGDSALLLVTPSNVMELTHEQHKNPPIGSGASWPTTFQQNVGDEFRTIAMTDGVWKYVGWNRIKQSAPTVSQVLLLEQWKQAARLTKTGRFPDDFTVVVLEAESVSPRLSQ
jgi:hypothetical protein